METAVQAWIVLGIIVVAVVLYAQGRLPMDLVSLGILALLATIFQLVPLRDATGKVVLDGVDFFQGLSNPALISVATLLVVGEGITRTGALTSVSTWIDRRADGSWTKAFSLVLIITALASAFMNNTPVVVIFIPILAGLASQYKIHSRKVLLPLSYISILGGACTLIGSSTNLLVADYAERILDHKMSMFSLTPVGIVLLMAGLAYLIFWAPKLISDEGPTPQSGDPVTLRLFTAEMRVDEGCPLIGQLLSKLQQDIFANVTVYKLIRGALVDYTAPFKEIVIKAGDILLVQGTVTELKAAEFRGGITITPYMPGMPLSEQDKKRRMLAELVITPDSRMVGLTLTQVRMRRQFGVAVVAINRPAREIKGRVIDTPLRPGDLLLVEGIPERIESFSTSRDFLLYWGAHNAVRQPQKARAAAGILLGIILFAALDSHAMPVLATVGATLMLAFRCLTLRQAYSALSSKVVLLITASLAMGTAMQGTGADQLVAHGFLWMVEGYSPWVVLAAFGFMVTVFTNVISNNATAILFAPIGVAIAEGLGVSFMPFLMMVIFGANAAFASPIGYKTNLLVFSVGGYRFADFFKVGLPLNVGYWLLSTLLIPLMWAF
ncbi:TrkA-C domain protein [Magnetococcus marinus MC-1]|uniref:TrkA-C domain protein n=1 Tax=Magnetococcus marinus (strain ATCC BAA-1437 / JCM 17883 / MC-1) TaxID=156889 RepID=A0LDF4_MAGMM|nr:SLC13 family permease [Magnetococcus marinus]ABK45997.1 TrkA-C domain protein [Magnetococcus marinus MC-1]